MQRFSDEVRASLRPFRTYRALAEETREPRHAFSRPLLMLAIIAGFVSLTSAGRLVAHHVFFAMIAWSFLPALQILDLLMTMAVFRSHRRAISFRAAIDLFYVGQGPWLFFLLSVAALAVFSPAPWPLFERLLDSGILLSAAVLVAVWSMVTTLAFFRVGLLLGPARAAAATLLYYAGFAGMIALYYTSTGQLVPLVWGTG